MPHSSKIERNIMRDKKKFRKLRRKGYKVLRVWEHQLKKDPVKVIEKIGRSTITQQIK